MATFPLDAVTFCGLSGQDASPAWHGGNSEMKPFEQSLVSLADVNWGVHWSCGLSAVLAQSVKASLIEVCCNNDASCFCGPSDVCALLSFHYKRPRSRAVISHHFWGQISPYPTLFVSKEKYEDAWWWLFCHESLMEMSVYITWRVLSRRFRCSSEINNPKISAFSTHFYPHWARTSFGFMRAAS